MAVRSTYGFTGQSLVFQDDAYIGITSDTDLLQLSVGILKVNGNIQVDDDANIGCDSDTDLLQLSANELIINGELGIGITPDGILHTSKVSAINWAYFDTYDVASSYSVIALRKSDSNSLGTKAQTDDGDILGDFRWNGVDSTLSYNLGASLRAVQDGVANTRVPCKFMFYTSTSTSFDHQLTITTSGNLQIEGDNKQIKFGTGNDAGIRYDGADLLFDSQLVGTGDYHFLNGHIQLTTDSQKIYFGGGDDCSITYNGTDMIINSQEVGSGNFLFEGGNIQIDDGNAIGIDSDTDLLTLASALLTIAGSLQINSSGFIGVGGDSDLIQLIANNQILNGNLIIDDGANIGIDSDTDLLELNSGILYLNGNLSIDADGNIGPDTDMDLLQLSAGILHVNGAIQIDDAANIGCDSDTDLIALASGLMTINGSVVVDDAANIGCDSDTDLLALSSGILAVNGAVQIDDDSNIGIDSDTDLLQLSSAVLIVNGSVRVDDDANIGIDSDTDLLQLKDGQLVIAGVARASTASYRRYYHLPLASLDPGASGATWTAPGANTSGGWQLDAASEVLYSIVDVHSDWDAASDLTVDLTFQINAASSEDDTVDIKIQFYYMGSGESSAKTQTVEVATNVGSGGAKAQYTQFSAAFTIDYDLVSHVVEAGDKIGIIINLETDTSEVDDIILNAASFYYNTTHLGVESSDT